MNWNCKKNINFCCLSLLLLILVCFPVTLSCKNRQGTRIKIPARPKDWRTDVFTKTDIQVKEGDIISFSASGKWNMGLGNVGPDGDNEGLGTLIGRIGKKGKIFLIGAQKTITAIESGILYLTARDNLGACDGKIRGSCYSDNRGSVRIYIAMHAEYQNEDHKTENFLDLNTQKWNIVKGSPIISDGKLILKSAPKAGVEVQSIQFFKYDNLIIKAKSKYWHVDTSIGLEGWNNMTHTAIVITNGHLGIINQSRVGENEFYMKIENWDLIKNQENIFMIEWKQGSIDLYINDNFYCKYEGILIPDIPLKIRLNASNDFADELVIDYIKVKMKEKNRKKNKK